MKLTQKYALCLGTAITLLGVCSSALAASFNWTYENEFGEVYTGTLEGTVQPDGNTVEIFKVENTKLDGTLLPATPFVVKDSTGLTPAIVSFDGSLMDFLACPDSACSEGFSFGGVPISFKASSVYGGGIANDETFSAAFWQLQTVPEPTSVLGILAGSTIASLLARKKKG